MAVLDLHQAAHLLNLAPATLARWVRQGLVVALDRERMLFEQSDLERWARHRGLTLGTVARTAAEPEDDLLASAVARGAVIRADPQSAVEAIALAVEAIPGIVADVRASLLEEILERERLASTGLGSGVAIPHPRKPPGQWFQEPLVSLVFLENPLDWAAIDAEAVHTVFLLIAPNAAKHLELLSRVAFALRSSGFPDFLRTKPSQGQLAEKLRSIRREA